MKRRSEWTEEEKLWVREGTIFIIAVLVIGVVTFQFLFIDSLSSAMKSGMSGFAALSMILPIFYVVDFLPGAVLGEFAYSRIKKRSFRPQNVLIFASMLAEWVLVAAALLALFNLILPGASFFIQFPLIAVSLSVPSLVIVATFRIGQIRNFMRKAFD